MILKFRLKEKWSFNATGTLLNAISKVQEIMIFDDFLNFTLPLANRSKLVENYQNKLPWDGFEFPYGFWVCNATVDMIALCYQHRSHR